MDKIGYIDALYTKIGPHRKGNSKQLCEVALNMAYNQIISSVLSNGRENFMPSVKEFTAVTIQKDGTTGTAYATYPVDIVSADGLITVNTVKGTGARFFPMREREVRLIEGGYAEGQMIEYGYIPKRERVEFWNIKDSNDDLIINSCTLELAIQFKEFVSTDTVLMPNGRDYEVLQLAEDWLSNMQIIDPKQDNY